MFWNWILIVLSFDVIFGDNLEVKTTSGVVRGITVNLLNKSVNQFAGIPYAEPPIGDLRFAKPKPLDKPLPDVIDGSKPKNSCLQGYTDYMKYIKTYSEDCLVVNVWTPKSSTNSSKLKPVMYWIHGGGLVYGSTYQIEFNGSVLATHDVVVASANYRLGPLGFLYGGQDSAPGNVGFYDQLLALNWIRDNIHLFGGDKNQITIFGESAGGWSVSAHLLSPLSKGLFKRAIMSSGAHFHRKDVDILTKDEALLQTKAVAKGLKCSDDKEMLSCLRKANAEDIIKFGSADRANPIEGTEFLPLRAQKAFEQKKFNLDLDLMSGVVKDEGSGLSGLSPDMNVTINDFKSFVKTHIESKLMPPNITSDTIQEFYLSGIDLKDSKKILRKIYDFFGDIAIKCPTFQFAKQYALQSSDKSKTFFYELTHAPEGIPKGGPVGPDEDTLKKLGVTHAMDNLFVFGAPFLIPGWKNENDSKFSLNIMKLWTDFTKYGKPDADNWKPFITGSDSVPTLVRELKPDSQSGNSVDAFGKTCDGFWREYYI